MVANADLERMRRENFKTFHAVPISTGFPPPGDATLLPAYRRNVSVGVFYPGLHGFTHFNVSALMKSLKEESVRGDRMRQLVCHGVPYLASLTPECNFALAERRDGDELFLPESEQAAWIEAGVRFFAEAFGRRPTTVCAPGYRSNEATFRVWRRCGLESAQFNGKRGIAISNGMIFLERNVSLEPALDKTTGAEAAIDAARHAVQRGLPIIICSHSINYISRFLGYAAEGRRELGELLHGLLKAFPNLRFANNANIVSAWKTKDPDWFRAPTSREIAARSGLWIGGSLVATHSPDEEDAPSLRNAVIGEASQADAAPKQKADIAVPVASRLGIASLYVFLGNAFTLVVGLPLQIYVSQILGADGVGVYGLLEATMGTATGLVGLGIGQTIVRFLPAHVERGEYGSVLGLLRMGGLIVLVVGGGAYAVLLLFLPWIGNFWSAVMPYRNEVAAMGLMIPIGLLLNFLQQSLRGFQEIRQIILGNSVLQLIVKLALTVAAFAIGWRLDGYIFATVFSAFCGVMWLFCELYKRLRTLPSEKPSIAAFPRWYRYAVISYSDFLLLGLASGLDRFLTGAFVSSGAVGILVVARQLHNLPEKFNQMFLVVGAPLLSSAHSRHNSTERQHIYCLMTDWSVRCSLPLVLFLLFFGHSVLALYGPEFANKGTAPLEILVAAQFLGLLCGPNGNAAMMSGLERQAVFMTGATTTLVSVLLVVLIPQFGLIGAALGIAFGTLFMNVGTTMLLWWKLNLHWWDKRYRAWLPPAAANLLLVLLVSFLPLKLGAVALFILLAAMYGSALVASIGFGMHDDDRDLLRYIWKRIGGNALTQTEHGR